MKIKVLQTASMLKQEGVHTRDKVAIVLPKGENQIIAVLAILSIGATYVPIGIHQPLDRKKKIFEAGNISYALTDRDHINTLDGADTLRSFLIENSFRYVVMPETEIVKDIDSIAYIIFTSGTTGIPKGVMITHKAAYNTIYDVNDKFTINEHDCAIAVSELDFDLSVYDIFGMLGYGASLIVLNEMNKREPYIWKKILCEKRVTIWNSVPALFEMFLLAIGYDYEKVTLKNILLSGDWIKLEIYPKVNKLWPECRFVSLGGATEAAIWSVYYEVHILDEPWTSIPYGRPLANQLLRVVNNKGKDSPVGVPGELWIGGYGVAEGYVNEEKLTQERFVKIDGIRWYKTGDKAQYFQDGNVQFLGRLDDQVKVNGYRIELGEIENVIKRAECIDDAIAMTVETNGKKEIVAAVVEKYEKGNASHQVFMNEENPEYAEIQEIRKKVVAAFILKVYGNNVDSLTPNDNIVINSNGKVEQYWNVWLLINNVISHKDSDEYVLNLEIKNVLSDIWYMKLETQIPMVQELIRGTVSASNLLTNGYLSPEELLVQGSDTVIFLEHVTKVIKHDSKVAVLGARTGLAVEMLLNNNLDRNVELTLIDESAGMLKRAEERLRRYDVQFEYYHFEDGLLEKSLLGQFDFVIALGELHRYKNPLHGLHVANMLLKAKGQLLALEYEDLDPMSIISSAILENGFSEYMRKRKNTALMTVDEWLTAFEESAFDDVMIKVYPTSSALFINANANKYKEWIELLKKYNYVTETDGIYVCKIEIYEKGLKYGWEEVEYLWKGKLESPLVLDYIINNIKNWDKLIQKEQQATLLLFEQGEDIYAHALYKETKILQYLNHSLSKKVLGYLHENANATILEIGAGTGATSNKVLSDIRENKFEEHIVYFYTDISRFFLQRAKERYKECDGKIEMHHQTLDIDEAFSSQLPSNFQADIVIAVGVLNNSVNTDKCIYEINSVMKPGGILLVIETVEDVPDILITQSFMMTAPKDRRKATNTMFLNRKQWLEILEENGFCNSEEFPGYGEYLEVLGQKLFYCTKE